jgi:3',5'-cyclic AMP phosphodiesterase CpdA
MENKMHFQYKKTFQMIIFTLILTFGSFITITNAQKIPVLKFNKEGKFKIVQFTDTHLKEYKKSQSDSVIMTMTRILEREKPDLVMLTGDIATSENVKLAWETVTKPMINAGIPWAVVFGNHDHEHGFTNKQIMDYLVTLPLNCSKQGPKNISGSGNYVIEVKDAKSKQTKLLLYGFDSNAYTTEKDNPELGEYDWIKFDQIKWYREESAKYTKGNGGKPYPALAFFHIPLPEYKEIAGFNTTVGDKDEDVSSPKINSGMYNAMLESKDVMGVFVGHDHNDNYIGCLNNICLAYGCKTGRDSYGKLDKGARVIVLYEGERKFDTWIETPINPVKYFVTYPESFVKK